MDKSFLYGVVGGLVGAVIVLFASSSSVNNQNYGMMRMMGMGRGVEQMMRSQGNQTMMDMMHGGEGMTMDDMVADIEGLEGEEFERKFIENMVEHHEGAIEMAELIPSRTERPELRQLGEAIISAQSSEIEMMEGWLRDWF